MFKLEIDYSELEKAGERIGAAADQMPYALALALNRSADVTRNLLIHSTWPATVQERNSSFIAASLTTKESRASKYSLSVEIYDKLDRGNLLMQAKGGTRAPMGGASLAVPSTSIGKSSHGVPTAMRPRNLPPSTTFKRGDVLYSKTKRSKRLRLLYVLKRDTKIPKRVPFYEDYEASMRRELIRTIPMAVEKAMSTRR